MDHVQPLALKGEDTDENVQTLRWGCHKLKTRKVVVATKAPF